MDYILDSLDVFFYILTIWFHSVKSEMNVITPADKEDAD